MRKKKGKKSKKERKTWRGRKGKEMQKVCSPIFSERESSFSLELYAIRPSDSFETRREVVLHGEDNVWTPVLGSFFKLQEVGYFPTWFTFSLKAL